MTRYSTRVLHRIMAVVALLTGTVVTAAGGSVDEQVVDASGDRWEQRKAWAGVSLPAGGSSAEHGSDLRGPSPGAEPVCPEGIDPGWWGTVQRDVAADIAASEYHIRWNENAGAYQSPNRAQNLRFTFWGDGFAAQPLAQEEGDHSWRLALRLAAWGREDATQEFQAGGLRVDNSRAEAEGRGVTVMYRNDREGMRQDFLVRERPGGTGPLRVWVNLEIDGAVMEVEPDGRHVSFRKEVAGGARVMSYGDLKVTDAAGRVLEAAIERDGDGCAIVVDDADAVYPVLIDPLSSSPDWTASGEGTGDAFGYSVATAGDVNGDGYSDVVVGAWGVSIDVGKAYLYLGSASGLSATASWIALGQGPDNCFGRAVGTAGDVNGDGYSDVVIGADGYASNTGRAYVYLGSASGLFATASWTKSGEAASNYFGRAVATAGDVNGDGYSDVVVGAYASATGAGKAYLYLGSASGLATTASWTKSGETASNYFGYSVASAGDVNGDGFSDVVIGAHRHGNYTGKAYLYLGSASGLLATASWTASGEATLNYFGYSVATAGDVNGDGFSDVLIGAHRNTSMAGRAYLYLGSASGLEAAASWTASGEAASNFFGRSVATAGDVNGDGYSDVVIGADGNAINTGKAYVYLGSASGLSATASWIALGQGPDNCFGRAVGTAGDVNGDGYSDVVVGAWGNTSETGKAYLYLGSASGPSATDSWTALGEGTDNRFGCSVATAGDVNGDGYSDVVAGAWGYAGDMGKAYLYLGSAAGLSTTASWTATGEGANNYLGNSVASAGDVNGDGYSDVVVGAWGYLGYSGKTYLYLGSASGLSATAAWTATGEGASNHFGQSVASAGDVNGDGYSDVVVGAEGYAGRTGKAYLYLGSATGLLPAASWTATGEGANNNLGNSVASAGDVNGDGYSDVVVGAWGNAGSYGKTYLYLGSASGLSAVASWTKSGEATSNYFGYSVASAGDVDGDNYSDVVVGAYGSANYTGKAYLYLGSAAGLSTTASWTATGESSYRYFGYSVASAGDVNGDGYSDVAAGAWGNAGSYGKTYLYLGSAAGLSAVASWTKSGEATGNYFGRAVASGGDVNGDGYSDVVVGTDRHTSNTGKAYLFYGNDGDGLHVLPRQWSPDLVTPVIPALKTRSPSQAGVGLLARTFFGRSDLRVQFEVKPLDTPFDGMGLVTTDWADAGTTGIAVSEVIEGLSDATMYRWRARVGYRMNNGAPQPYGRWVYQPYNGGLGEADFRAGDYVPPGAPAVHIVPLSPTQCRLWWHPVSGALSYDLYRGTFAYFVPGAPWQTVAAPDTTYDFTDGVGDPATTYYFLSRTVGTAGESDDSGRVGEHEVALP
ncbi:FG-GAP repeat protein [Candidatus Fermentibacteria bacterium]|nr:FG-GAP repeat protein [Candidatus Fermentibacteria bacterium]